MSQVELAAALAQLETLLARGNGELAAFLREQHPADLAELLEELTEEQRAAVFRALEDAHAAEVLGELDRETQAEVLQGLDAAKAGDILEEMSADDAADLLGELSPEASGQILGEMAAQDAADVRDLLEYPPDSAGGIMTTEFVAVRAEMSAQSVIEYLRQVAPDAETIYYVYVVDDADRLAGVLSLRDLIVAAPSTSIRNILRSRVITVPVEMDQEAVAQVVKKYDLMAVPVTDAESRLVGVITVDDVIDVIEEEATEDIYRMASTADPEESGAHSVWRAARARLPWLVGLLVMELFAARVVEGFAGVIQAAAILAAFMPAIAGEAGNAATQSLAVVVRGLATGEVEPGDMLRVIWRELRVGLVVGLACGAAVFLIALMWKQDVALGAILALALAVNLPVAKLLGATFPILIQRFGVDPAVASGPFITTLTDVASMLTYFSIAAYVLTHFALAG